MTRGAPTKGSRARGVAAATMLQVGRGIDARGATVRGTCRTRISAVTVRANCAGRAGGRALAAVRRIAAEIDAILSAAREWSQASLLAAPCLAGHRGADTGLARLATAAAVQHIRIRIDAAAATRQGVGPTSEGAAATHAHRRCPGWRAAGLAAGAAVLGVAIELHALAAAQRFAVSAFSRGAHSTRTNADVG